MSYPSDGVEFEVPSQRRRQAGGCSPLMLLVMAGIAFFFFMKTRPKPVAPGNATQPEQEQVVDQDRPRITSGPIADGIQGRTSPSSTAVDNSGDWSIDEVKSTQRTPAAAQAQRTDEGDWSIEEVESSAGNSSDRAIRVDGQSQPAAPKRTQKGDWELEEVGSK